MKIQVTQEDIDNGLPEEPKCCPVALALIRILGVPVYVETEYICINPNENYPHERVPGAGDKVIQLPMAIQNFIAEFDDSPFEDYKPFEFDLPIEQP